MSAKVLSEREFKRVLAYIASHSHASRNRAMLLMTHLAGMRVGEVAVVTIADVLNSDGSIRDEIFLMPQNSKKRGANCSAAEATTGRDSALSERSVSREGPGNDQLH
jgi:integrase